MWYLHMNQNTLTKTSMYSIHIKKHCENRPFIHFKTIKFNYLNQIKQQQFPQLSHLQKDTFEKLWSSQIPIWTKLHTECRKACTIKFKIHCCIVECARCLPRIRNAYKKNIHIRKYMFKLHWDAHKRTALNTPLETSRNCNKKSCWIGIKKLHASNMVYPNVIQFWKLLYIIILCCLFPMSFLRIDR